MIPCPNCCGTDPCTIVTVNPFADLDAFTQIGTVTITSGAAVLETGEAIVTVAGPTNFYDPVILTLTASTEDSSGTLRLGLAFVDTDGYLFGEYDFAGTTGTLRLGKREGGSEEWLTDAVEVEDTTNLGDLATLILCWVPGEVQEGGSFELFGATGLTIVDAGTTWVNKDNVQVEDGSPAQYPYVAGGNSESLSMINFPIVLPPGTIIDGIELTVKIRDGSEASSAIRLLQVQLLDGTGTAVGDIEGEAGVTAFNPAWSTYEYGSPTSILNSGITWEDVNSPLFGFYIIVENQDEFERQAEVDYMAIDLYYTTPDLQPGRLTLSRGNVGSVTVDCARAYNVTAPGEGKQAMVRSGSGTWDVASLNYQYHESEDKPSCPACECTIETIQACVNCCDPSFPPAAAYVVDFGAGGWTDDECERCDFISGEIVIDLFFGLTEGGSCTWYFAVGGLEDCTVVMFLSLRYDEDEEACYWRLVVGAYTYAALPGGGFSTASNSVAVYESDFLESGEDCQTEVTLDKVSEAHWGDAGPSCSGALPATVAMEPAP